MADPGHLSQGHFCPPPIAAADWYNSPQLTTLGGMGNMSNWISLLCLAAIIAAANPALASDQAKTTGKDTPKAKVDPGQRKPDAAKVKEQTVKAQQYYKDVAEVATVPLRETAHFIIVGQFPKRTPE